MKARYKGAQERTVTRDRLQLTFSPGNWQYLPSISWYNFLRQYPTEFDVICEFDLEPFKKAGLKFSFKGKTVSTDHKPTIRYFDGLSTLRLQATLPEEGTRIYRINTFSNTYLGSYASMISQVRVLCFRTKGGIGDIIMTLPVLEAIKKKYPNYVVDYACPRKFMPLLENFPYVNKVLEVGEANTVEYEITYDMTRKCIQYEGKHQPHVDLNRTEIFGMMGGIEPSEMPRVKLFLKPSEIRLGLCMDLKQSAEEQCLVASEEYSNQQLIIGVCTESSAPVRSYPYPDELLSGLLGEYPEALIVYFQKDPKELLFEHPNLLVMNDFSFREIMTIANRCDIFIGPDTGLCHIASSLRTPTLWLFTHIDGAIRTRGYDTSEVLQDLPPACGLKEPCWYGLSCNSTGDKQELGAAPPCALALTPMKVLAQVRSLLSTPNISFLVVCHNRVELTEECIQEIMKVKKYSDEIILIDNGSTDGTQELFSQWDSEDFRLRYIREHSNTGCVLARNKGISLAEGRFIWMLDNDQFIKYFSLDKIKATEGDIIGVEGWWINEKGMAERSNRTGMMNYVGAGGMFAKRVDLRGIGAFDPEYSPAWFEDPDICFKATQAGLSLGLCDEAFIEHRPHSTNHTQTDFDSGKIWKRNREYFNKKWEHLYTEAPLVSVVILTHNSADITIRCLDRIYETAEVSDIEVIIVDNGSNREEKNKLIKYGKRPHMKVIYSGENMMVAKGRNAGASFATGDFLLFLDNDMVLPAGWLPALVRTLDENNVVATSPMVVDIMPDKQHTRFISTRIEDGRIKESIENIGPVDTDFLPGGSLFVKRSLFEKIKFDENFVFGVEDYDWCLRVKREGFGFMTCPDVVFLHAKPSLTRTVTKYDDEERRRKGSSFIEDSIRLFLYRWKEKLPNQWEQPGWMVWAVGKGNPAETKNFNDLYGFIEREVQKRYPEEIERGAA